jgi:hypothetical protein
MKKVTNSEKVEIINNKNKEKEKVVINEESKNNKDKIKSKEKKKDKGEKLKKEEYKQEKEGKNEQIDIIIESKYINFNLDFIYRREKYTLKNLYSNYLISKLKKLISKKLSIEINLIHIYYQDKEITDDKLNVYDLIKDNKTKYFLVKKEPPINEDLVSLNTNQLLSYKLKCTGIQDYKDFLNKIESFFIDRCLDKHYICEPLGENGYLIGFSCEDICFQFKRYMLLLKKIDDKYINSKCEFKPIDKSVIINSKINIDLSNNKYNYKESEFINKGPYMTYEEMQRKNEKEEKKKWINKNGFKI